MDGALADYFRSFDSLRVGERKLKSHVLTLNDGDQLFIEYVDRNSDHTLSIFHGLGGHGRSDYMRRSANLAAALNWNVVLVNHRLAHSKAEAKKAIEELNGAEVSGRNIIVNESIERTDRRSNFRGGDNDRRGGSGGGNRRENYR